MAFKLIIRRKPIQYMMKLLNIMSINRFVIVTKTHSVLFGLKFDESWVVGDFYRFDNFMTL